MTLHNMQRALILAEQAASLGEVPVGAVMTDAHGQVVAEAHNLTESHHNPLAHAEMLVIQQTTQKRGQARLADCTLTVTLEPCAMCAAAISHARIKRLVFGAYDVKGGAVDHGPRWFAQPTCHHVPEVVGGVCEQEAAQLLQNFFKSLR